MKNCKVMLSFLCCYILTISVSGQSRQELHISSSDIDNFWKAYDSILYVNDDTRQVELMRSIYIDKGTHGLKEFMSLRNFDASTLVRAINSYPNFWKSIRPNTLKVKEMGGEIMKYIEAFQKLYPDFREGVIYFTITPLKSGGTTKDSLLLIGTEIATGDRNTDTSEFPDKRLESFFENQTTDNIVPFTIHEFVHIQQATEGEILLGQVIYEGACDFITELVLGTDLQHAYLVYGRTHEKILKEKFKKEMYSKDFDNWLYNGAKSNYFGDLGYFIGYSICKSYYNNSKDKKKAIKDIIELNYADIEALEKFLIRSKYY